MSWNEKLNKKKELEILKAVDKLEFERKQEPAVSVLWLKFKDSIFKFYSKEVRESCTYPECGSSCAFKDNKQLCPVQAVITYTVEHR